MTQNQDANLSAPGVEQRRCRPSVRWAAFFAGALLSNAQVTNVQVGVTATQAVITYSAPDNNPCAVEIHEGGDLLGPLAHDVDPALFAGANLDSGPSSTRTAVNAKGGARRIFVVGKRVAEPALDGFRYSRALQIDTVYTYKITCGVVSKTGPFKTMNAPVGMSYNDPIPVDPNRLGEYAWPNDGLTDRNKVVVDPLTGFRIKLLDGPRDAYENAGSGNFVSGSNVGSGTDWTNPNNIASDDTAAATYSGATQGFLFADLGIAFQNSAQHNPATAATNTIVPTFKAWCSGADCGTAGGDDRSIQF